MRKNCPLGETPPRSGTGDFKFLLKDMKSPVLELGREFLPTVVLVVLTPEVQFLVLSKTEIPHLQTARGVPGGMPLERARRVRKGLRDGYRGGGGLYKQAAGGGGGLGACLSGEQGRVLSGIGGGGGAGIAFGVP